MRVRLMQPDRDFDPAQPLPSHEAALRQDLELDVLLHAMAAGDEFLFETARRALLAGVQADVETIRYRQEIVRDCLANPGLVRALYAQAVEALERRRQHYIGFLARSPGLVLYAARDALQGYLQVLRALRRIADTEAARFRSRGFAGLFAMLRQELSDEYLAQVDDQLKALRFRRGVLVSAALDEGNEGTGYVLRRPLAHRPSWTERLLGAGPRSYTFAIDARDEAGMRILSEMRELGITQVADALARAAEHIQNFFARLRAELAFYVGCLNLHAALAALGAPVCFPEPAPAGSGTLHADGLYDASLALTLERDVVGNALDADGRRAVIITGANQGGKSTFLRALGSAQLMMQAGMFVAAESFAAAVCRGVFTHYKREEDTALKSGKLDEELARMSGIVDALAPGALVLLNESFAATNQREGSEIARQIVGALLDRGIRVYFVTHLYEFARRLHEERAADVRFLRAERRADGTRTFRLVEGEPLETSYGEDLYREVFAGAALDASSRASA